MSKQLEFFLAEIDREKTKAAVESALERYRYFLLSESVEMTPRVTASYSIEPPVYTNQFHSATEDLAIRNVDLDNQRRQYIKQMVVAVNRLGHMERAVLIQRYMTEEDVYDYEVYNELGMSERKYYRLKSRAFYKLAFALRLEVYREVVSSS
ncbi:ArpU family phage packaging/lysis transcriptional regulator [Domibacillus aminovorans]|uniref:ArpU family phage packaging/lysis transcriptional regulator n=1 Tax=Domibacillus aminovorans TaxID=29332 RepID=UPI003D263BD3